MHATHVFHQKEIAKAHPDCNTELIWHSPSQHQLPADAPNDTVRYNGSMIDEMNDVVLL
jgi:hypothetical protein